MRSRLVERGLKPYWPEKMPENICYDNLRYWESQIYPIWAGIFKRAEDQDSDTKSPPVEPITTIHAADKALFEAGIRPNREWQDKKSRDVEGVKSRFKQAREDGYVPS